MGCSVVRAVEIHKHENKSEKLLVSNPDVVEKVVVVDQKVEESVKSKEEEAKVEISEENDKQIALKDNLPEEVKNDLIQVTENVSITLNCLALNQPILSEKHSSNNSVVDDISLKCGSVCSEILEQNEVHPKKTETETETELKSPMINSNQIVIKVHASRYEAMYPVWVEDSKKISFQVTGEWIVADSLASTTSQGIPTDVENSFYNGALVGRVLGGDYFAVTNGLTYESRTSGPLFLKMYLTNFRVSPKGTLNISISGACEMNFSEIEEKIGWDKSQLIPQVVGTNLETRCISELEQSTLIFLNKMRINPVLFAQQYLENIRYLTKSTLNLYNSLITSTQTFPPLKVNANLINLAVECYNSFLESKDQLSTYVLEEIERNININSNSKSQCREVKVNIKMHDDFKPLSLAIKFILDEKIRNNIFDKNTTDIGLIVMQLEKIHSRYNASVLLFSSEIDETVIKDNLQLSSDKNEV